MRLGASKVATSWHKKEDSERKEGKEGRSCSAEKIGTFTWQQRQQVNNFAVMITKEKLRGMFIVWHCGSKVSVSKLFVLAQSLGIVFVLCFVWLVHKMLPCIPLHFFCASLFCCEGSCWLSDHWAQVHEG